MKSVALLDFLSELSAQMNMRAQEKEVAFSMRLSGSMPEPFYTDSERLRQILIHLIGNAIQSTDRGAVLLTVAYERDGQRVRFAVSDGDVEMQPEDRADLFQPLDLLGTTGAVEGRNSAPGLTIARLFTQSLGGEIVATRELGKGNVFTFVLNCAAPVSSSLVQAADGRSPAAEPPQVPVRISGCILVVDDRRDIRFLAQHFIERAGGQVVTANDGQAAVEFLTGAEGASQRIDLVLMDMQMPILDGFEAVKQLREHGFERPIIALTANAMREDRERCLGVGCSDYTTKPLDGMKLVELIARYLHGPVKGAN